MPRKLLVGGVQRSSSVKGIKKVAPPVVPTLNVKAAQYRRSPCICNGDDQLTIEFGDCDSDYNSYNKPPRSPPNGSNNFIQPFFTSSSQQTHPMKKMTPGGGSNGQIHLAHVIVHSQPDSLPSTPSDTGHSPSLSKGRLMSGTQASLEDQGIDMNSPGRHSPGGSSGGSSISRHSLSSLDSGRASGPGSDSGKVVNRRLSIQSYEGCSPQRRSYHSSSSSIASVGDDMGPGPNVAEMVLHGLPDVEVLSSWLATLHFEEYIPLFLLAGYDMPTITRMTPEDLTAIGITKPNHRRKLKAEIAKLNISDGIPEYKPDTLYEWLQLLRLEEYYETLSQQNYDTVDKVTDLTWEDLEDIGIQKLGHQKRILLAIKRIEDINHGRRPNLYPQSNLQNRIENTTYLRPTVLSNVQQPLHYPAQEIAIATQRPKSSPSTESIPEMKTFQQSPLREENLFIQALHNSAQNIVAAQNATVAHNSVPNAMADYNSMQIPMQNSQLSSMQTSMQNSLLSSMQTSLQNSLSNSIQTSMQNSLSNSTNYYNAMPNSIGAQDVMQNSTNYNSIQNAPVAHNSVQNNATAMMHQNGVLNPVISPTRGRSLESLNSENISTTNCSVAPTSTSASCTTVPQNSISEQSKNPTKDWHVTDLDQEYDYECEGTATLNRPKGLVKLRPMAKITAKTREEIAEAIMDIPDSEFKSLINNQSRTLDGWSSLDGSPRHGPSTVPRSATLRRAPPPVPKRSNSAKGDKPPIEPPKESAVARLKINPAKMNSKPNLDNNTQNSGEFPPPPMPLPSAVEEKSGAEKDSADELFNNPLFKQRRKDSAESSSSIDSAALPFANEAVGTIKQKAARSYPALPMDTSSNHRGSKSQKSRSTSDDSQSNMEHEYDLTPEVISPGDVIDDIENMLANLSDQLDAMLDDEVQK